MAGRTSSQKCQQYLSSKRRITNKQRRLDKFLEYLKKQREKTVINPNTKQEVKRKPLENIIKSCRIGREKEGFQKEEFKFRRK